MERLLLDLSINVTAMFRDPELLPGLPPSVVPILRTYPFLRIWNAGCSTGEETYSLAILLAEEGLLDRTRIYATDINQPVLAQARDGVFPLEKMREYTENYLAAGGTRAFSEYYVAAYDGARFDPSLADNVVFAQHNLVADRSFNEFHVVVCRNVLIYFDKTLQDRVHRLFHDSLARFGDPRFRARRNPWPSPPTRATTRSSTRSSASTARRGRPLAGRAHPVAGAVAVNCGIVVVGSSWGGLSALVRLLDGLPADLSLAGRHRPAPAGHAPPGWRRSSPARPVGPCVEAEDKEPMFPAVAYVAPPGYHLLVERPGHLALSTEGPVRFARPSIDVLFESAADAYRADAVGIVLTGTNDDGAAGLASIVARGGWRGGAGPGVGGAPGACPWPRWPPASRPPSWRSTTSGRSWRSCARRRRFPPDWHR